VRAIEEQARALDGRISWVGGTESELNMRPAAMGKTLTASNESNHMMVTNSVRS
jgi:hypothetical protein